jgi:flagellar basal-body rod protein FlgF/flagellar basal-body rod protein FlgG
MYYGLYVSAAGAHAQSQKVEVLSNNLANVDTVGFKRELALLEARDSESIERGQSFRGSRSVEDIGGGIRMPATATDFALGSLRQTNVPTDFAIEDPNHFFLVKRGDETLLTRAGNFRLDSEGRLVTQEGDAVLDSEGSPIQLDPLLPWRMLQGGVIDQFGEQYPIGLVTPPSRDSLRKLGTNYFADTSGNAFPVPAEQRAVRNGWQELSSVNPVREMVELIAASRTYETNIRLIQQHDGMTSSLVGRMLRAM